MPEIHPIQPHQAEEARRVIYTVAHQLFHDRETLEDTIAYYATRWPLLDVVDYQRCYRESGGDFLVLMDGERIIGTGALKRLEEGVDNLTLPAGEIKRLWLLPEYQGRGLGYQMMQRLLDLAREMGYERVRLETSPAYQARAFSFYQRLGFYEIPRYGDDEEDVGMELLLR